MTDAAYAHDPKRLSGGDLPDVGEARSYMRVRIGTLMLAIEAADVDEITDLNAPVPLPRAPAHLLGLMPLNDRSVPLVALDVFVGSPRPRADRDSRLRVIIVSRDGMRVGIACDEVHGLREIGQRALIPLSQTMTQGIAPYATHEHVSEDGRVLILDLPAFLAAAKVRKR